MEDGGIDGTQRRQEPGPWAAVICRNRGRPEERRNHQPCMADRSQDDWWVRWRDEESGLCSTPSGPFVHGAAACARVSARRPRPGHRCLLAGVVRLERRGEARRGDGSKERCLSAGREACAMRWQAGHRRASRVLVLVLAEAEAAARGKRKVSTCVRDDRVGEQRRRAGRRGNQGPRR